MLSARWFRRLALLYLLGGYRQENQIDSTLSKTTPLLELWQKSDSPFERKYLMRYLYTQVWYKLLYNIRFTIQLGYTFRIFMKLILSLPVLEQEPVMLEVAKGLYLTHSFYPNNSVPSYFSP